MHIEVMKLGQFHVRVFMKGGIGNNKSCAEFWEAEYGKLVELFWSATILYVRRILFFIEN
jgi:hypothetical protein